MKKRYGNRRKLIGFMFLLGFSMALTAQTDVDTYLILMTDRPDATEASSLVPKGTLQVETGGFYQSFR